MTSREPLLDVQNLTIEFPLSGRWTPVVQDVSFSIEAGQTVGLVGESGSGKTVTSLALLGLIQAQGARIANGSIRFEGGDLAKFSESEFQRIRGERIGMIFQQPTRSLNPAYTVGEQIAETLRYRRGLSRRAAWNRAVDLLDRVRIPQAARRAAEYPHMFSGGMCQRVMIAMALACEPVLLIADEPTTALDVTVQAKILDLLRTIQSETGISILFISHDLAVIAQMCAKVVVMYAGQVVECANAEQVFVTPMHPYTEGLLSAIPRRDQSSELVAIPGNVPLPGTMPTGCRFHPRCDYHIAGRCDSIAPGPRLAGAERSARCLRIGEVNLKGIVLA